MLELPMYGVNFFFENSFNLKNRRNIKKIFNNEGLFCKADLQRFLQQVIFIFIKPIYNLLDPLIKRDEAKMRNDLF